ncbi:copper amine oxidase N-terminal domain-containing protein [Paenibacillus oenotherae]|uniref:Copper amine oxidase N-terminal domain-containing protein n=1 Tax=Paenibacillus oenotherae TaxID=1435645 RepID=A0ABS7D8G3_9BACL|nr:copper amine oxidase N-terminal domain-containing protein [Paenibacillus oenotherae]MBW7476155.1 copper amine oxidase N-terminal domain-containing protein [Paenibacillus oenotherae]
MKRTTRLGITALAAAMMISGASSFVYGDSDQAKATVAINMDGASAVKLNYPVAINGVLSTETGYLHKDGKTVMLPLRALVEALGYKIAWNGETKSAELTRGAQWTSVKVGEDQYSFAKMLIKLGIAPQSIGGKVYVPESFASQVLQADVTRDGKQVNVVQEEKKTMTTQGFVTGIAIKDGKGQIHINGAGTAGLVLNVDSSTKITDEDGKELTWESLLLGMDVEAVHAIFSTLSLPPQTPLYELKVKTKTAEKEILGTAGTIEEVMTGDDGTISVLIKGEGLSDRSPAEVRLNLLPETIVAAADGSKLEAAKLVKGSAAIGFYNPMLTKSLPPQGNAWKIIVMPDTETSEIPENPPVR